jgi:hypothetical protein
MWRDLGHQLLHPHKAGIPARMMEFPGHGFTVIGLADGYKANDARTWGKNAFFVDGWYGANASEVPAAQWMAGATINWWGPVVDDRRSDVTGGYDNLANPEVRTAGVLVVHVTEPDARTGSPVSVAGARVQISGLAQGTETVTLKTQPSGMATTRLPGGSYKIVALSPAGKTPERASAPVQVEIKGDRQKTEVTLSLPRVAAREVVWVLKEGYPQLRPEPRISLKSVEEYRKGSGHKYESWENIITAADRLSAHYKYEDTHARHTIIEYRFDFRIQFDGGRAPQVLRRGEKYWVTLSGKATGGKEPADAFTLGDQCLLKAEANGLEVRQVMLGVGENPRFPEYKPSGQVRCPFWLVENPPAVIVMDFAMPGARIVGQGNAPRLVRYVYERQDSP